MKTLYCLLTVIFVLLILQSCKAPHDNPLDPDSDFYTAPQDTSANITLTPHIHSIHISRNFPTTDSYSVLARIFVVGEITPDSVFVQYRSNTRVFLLPLTVQGEWATLFSSNYFSDQTLGSVIGQPFTFTVEDESGSEFFTPSAFLFRVIEGTPQLLSPRNSSIENSHPVLQWSAFSANFPFSYKTSVILLLPEGNEALAWSSNLLASSFTSIQVSDSLADGDYYWTLSVQDSFENSSRSKESYFTVVNP